MKKLLFSVLFALGLLNAAPAFSAVALDQAASGQQNQGGVTTFTFTNQTVGAALSNGYLVVGLLFNSQSVSGVTCTWDSGGTNQAMTNVLTYNMPSSNIQADWFGLKAPTSGNKTLSCSWTTSALYIVFSSSYSGVNQTTPVPNTATNSGNTSAANSVTVTVTTTSGDMAIDLASTSSTGLSSPNQTQLTLSNGSIAYASQNAVAVGTSVVFTWTPLASEFWGETAIDLAAASGASAPPSRALLGVGQ